MLPLVFLALYAAVRSLGAGANDVYKALGRPGLSIAISVVRLVILVPVLLVAAQWGIVGVAAAQLAVAFVFACGMQVVAARVIKIRARRLVRAAVPGLVCGAAVAVAGLGTLALPILGPVATAAVVVVVAVGLVYAILRLGFPSLYRELLKFVRRA